MDGDTAWLLTAAAAWTLFILWAWRRLEAKEAAAPSYRSPPDEPCWTELVSTEGRLSYGRYGCYHSELAEMEARVRMGDFGASG